MGFRFYFNIWVNIGEFGERHARLHLHLQGETVNDWGGQGQWDIEARRQARGPVK